MAMDVKAPFAKYGKSTGVKVDVEKIKQSIDIIKNSGIDYEFRTTVVPEIHELRDIKIIAKQIAPAKKFFVQNFRNDKECLSHHFNQVNPFDEFELQKVVNEIKKYFDICYLR